MPNIIINNTCNQRCTYCFAEDSMYNQVLSEKNQKMSIFIQILKFFKVFGYKDVRFLGGEPLLHPRLEEMILLAHKGGFDTRMFSNLNFPNTYIKKKFSNLKSIPQTINANINNRDFYSDEEYKQVLQNLIFFKEKGTLMTIGYNMYDLSKSFDDIAKIARESQILHINLKITNTGINNSLIIDTGSREYGEYIYNILRKYGHEFKFIFSCGLSKNIFSNEEIIYMNSLGIFPKYGCDGFSGKFDIDIDGSIYKCFPMRTLYLNKKLSIFTFNHENDILRVANLIKSEDICLAHTFKG